MRTALPGNDKRRLIHSSVPISPKRPSVLRQASIVRVSNVRSSATWGDRSRMAAAAVCYVAIAVLSSVPGEFRPDVPGLSDKLEHVFAFFILGSVTVLAAPGDFSWQRFLRVGVSYAVILEVTQVLIPGREASFLDLFASLTGAILGVSLGLLLRSPFVNR